MIRLTQKRRFLNCGWFRIIFASALIAGVISCENTPTEVDDYDPEVVLYAYLGNGEPMTEVYLERISSLFGYYTPKGIAGASVWIMELDEPTPDTFFFKHHPNTQDSSWLYVPDGDTLIPQSLKGYKIEVHTPRGEHLWSQAVVPGKIDWVSVSVSGVDSTTITDPPLEVEGLILDTLTRWNSSIILEWTDILGAGGFVGIALCQEPADTNLIPLDPDWDPIENPVDTINISRRGWTIMRYDQNQTTIPGVAFQWVGLYQLQFQAVSREYYDYLFSDFRAKQGMITRPESNINGGMGTFGSMTRFICYVYFKKVEQ